MRDLSESDKLRYSRQIKLLCLGELGQAKLLRASVLLIGAGGLSSPIGLYLAGAGVGTIAVVDPDVVHISNLHRQVFYDTGDASSQAEKASKLGERMLALNPAVNVVTQGLAIDAENISPTITDYDLVVDGTDNYATKFVVADACQRAMKPLLSGAVHAMSCQLALYVPQKTACYRCLFSEPPAAGFASCEDDGVLGTVAGTAALMMATEAIKFLSGGVPAILGNMLIYDAELQTIRSIKISRDEHCKICGISSKIAADLAMPAEGGKIGSAPEVNSAKCQQVISARQAKHLIDRGAVCLDVREESEFRKGSLAAAKNYPVSRLLSDARSGVFDYCQGPIILFCQTGKRSMSALPVLSSTLNIPVYSLGGGLNRWLSENS